MPVTPNQGLPYPVLTDTADVPRDIKALADKLDLILVTPPSGGGGTSLTQLPILDVGMTGQRRAGRELTPTDFTSRGLSVPLGLWNLSNVNDSSGNNRHLTNKTSVPFGAGINGAASTAAVFSGATNQALYIADTGGSDPFRIKTGSWGCWFRTAKRGVNQWPMSRVGAAGTAAVSSYGFVIGVPNAVGVNVSSGTTASTYTGTSDVCDDRWHFVVGTVDGTLARVYVDGALEAIGSFAATLNGPATALNIGGFGADAGTAASAPFYGRVDEAFVTADVLSEDQIRGLYAAKIAHGYTLPPGTVGLSVRRRRRGGTLAAGDFPAQPVRLHNFTGGSLNDEGSGGVALVANPGTGSIVAVAGADGALGNAYSFAGAHNGLSATDAGLPAGTAARSHGLWFKTSTTVGNLNVDGWGTLSTGDARLMVVSGGALTCYSAGDAITGPNVADGQWHHAVAVEDNAAGDGVKRKLYLDGRLVGGSTVLNGIVLAGANRYRVGADPNGTNPFTGQTDGAFVHNAALDAAQVAALYAKGSAALMPSPKASGDHVEGVDNANLYAVFDSLETTDQIDLVVTA